MVAKPVLAAGLAGLASALLVAAAPSGRAEDAYVINAVLSLSGNGAFLGTSEQRTMQVIERLVDAEGGIKGTPLHFVFHDDQSSPQLAVQLISPIVQSDPAVMIGPNFVATCNAATAMVKGGPVMWCLSPGIHPTADGYVFTVPIATRDGQKALVRYFLSRGMQRLAFIASTDATGREAESDLDAVLASPENHAMKMVAREHFNPADLSAIAQMERIKATAPQVVFAWSTGAAVATLFKAIVQTGLDVPVATTSGNMTLAQMAQYGPFLPQELDLPSSVWAAGAEGGKVDPAVDAAEARFFTAMQAAGIQPDNAATLAWDPVMIVIDGLRRLGLQATAAQLHDHILHLKGYGGINGHYDFERTPQRGIDVSDAVVVRWTPSEHFWKVVSQPAGAPRP